MSSRTCRFGSKLLESVGLRAGLVWAREVMRNLVRDEEMQMIPGQQHASRASSRRVLVGWKDCHFRQCRKADGYCENRKGRRGAFCRFSKARSEAELSLPKLYCSRKAKLYPPRPSLRIASMP